MQATDDLDAQVTHGYVDHDGVKIHYASLGAGPLVVLIHGFPDYWETWRAQMPALAAAGYRAVALDLRGYNLSDKPAEDAAYAMSVLIGDVVAVIHACGEERATIIGHDWGGIIAWQLAMYVPPAVARLVVLSTPHPALLARELATNAEMQRRSQYAQDFQEHGASPRLPWETVLTGPWLKDSAARARHTAALARSDRTAMLAYYRVNYPRPPYAISDTLSPKIAVSTLVIYGLGDSAFVPESHEGTWRYVERDTTVCMLPGVGHFVQAEAADFVSNTVLGWLATHRDTP